VSNIHRVRLTTRKFRARSGILFIGSFQHPPNADAVEFYLREVHPIVRKKLPDVEFTVIGADPPERLRHLADEGIRFVGHVENIQTLFANARLSVAPLRFGAGVKGKINSSMSFGVPVVTTSIGAEGMGLKHGEHAMIADTPDSFSDAVLAAYSSKRLWSRLVRGGVENLESYFSVEFARTALARIVDTDRVTPSALQHEAGE
jgi:glycosyltransferase involved in cell wall biosynthesis